MSEYLEHITSVENVKDKIKDLALDMYNKGRVDGFNECRNNGYEVAFANGMKQGRADERENIIEEVDLHLREAGYEYDSNMGIGDNIGSALLKEYANGYKKGEQDGKADGRAKIIAIVERLKDSVPVNRIIDDIINDKPKELGMLIAYDNILKELKEQK